jgi:hypothetical protein
VSESHIVGILAVGKLLWIVKGDGIEEAIGA